MARIAWTDKEDRRVDSVPEKYKVTASTMAEIKASVNALYDYVEAIKSPTVVAITTADFSGSNYDNAALVDLVAGIDFQVYTNGGSGVLLKPGGGEGYVYDSALGRLTMEPESYLIMIFKPVA